MLAFNKSDFDVGERLGGKNMGSVKYDKETTALLVIGPYNDFISEGGKVWGRLKALGNRQLECQEVLQ